MTNSESPALVLNPSHSVDGDDDRKSKAQDEPLISPDRPPPDGLWDQADMPAVNFAFFARDEIPRSSFWVLPGERVVDVGLFLQALRRDLHLGPDHVCGRSALRRAKALKTLFGRRARRGREIISREISNAGRLPAKPR